MRLAHDALKHNSEDKIKFLTKQAEIQKLKVTNIEDLIETE